MYVICSEKTEPNLAYLQLTDICNGSALLKLMRLHHHIICVLASTFYPCLFYVLTLHMYTGSRMNMLNGLFVYSFVLTYSRVRSDTPKIQMILFFLIILNLPKL